MKTVVFDMDGVLYRGNEILPDAADCVTRLIECKFSVGYLTNNSARSRCDYVEKLSGMGIPATIDQVMTSGEATVRYLQSEGIRNGHIYVIGETGLADALQTGGFTIDISDEGPPCDYVIIGWDRHFTFNKIVRAQKELRENGARFIATNSDAMFPASKGRILPGAGTMVAAVEVASGVKPLIIGKPNTISLKFLLENLGMKNGTDGKYDELWVVGDRLDTDIACGNALGAHTVLVTTGISTREQAENSPDNQKPEFVIDSLSELPGIISRIPQA
ncbi:MAG: HAD-IIA family hydrolase [bacterium]